MDGGLADNIGMRSVLELSALVGSLESSFEVLGVTKIRKLVYLMVSAETDPDVNQYQLDELPSLSRVLNAFVDIPVNRYSDDTFELMDQIVTQWRKQLQGRARNDQNIFAPDADIYLIKVSLSELEDLEEQARLMNIPTNLSLTGDQVDQLLQAASKLVRNNKDFQRLLRDLEEEAARTPLISSAHDSENPAAIPTR
jgi:NTE family protein